MTSHGTVNWMATIGGMVLVVGIFTDWRIAAVGGVLIVLGIFSATRS